MKKSLKTILLFFFLIIFSNSSHSFAGIQPPRIERLIPNSIGSGARAIGMGGAFIAIADDATAASWNPGGLIQLEKPEFAVVVNGFHRIDNNTFAYKVESSGKQAVSKSRINYISIAYPFTFWKRDMVVSLTHQNLYDFTRSWDFPLMKTEKEWSEETDYHNDVTGSLSALGISYSFQFTPHFSFGLTLNFWRDGLYKNEWKEEYFEEGIRMRHDTIEDVTTFNFDKYSFRGFNANFGILWNISDKFTFGAVLKTPFEADLRYEHLFDSKTGDSKTFHPYNENITMDMPMSFGIGFAYRFSDMITVSLDISRTEWDNFVLTSSDGKKTSPITGEPIEKSGIDPAHQIRMGAEYLFIGKNYEIPLCAGIFYDPLPAEGSPDDFFGFSVGSGIGIGRFKFDFAYQYKSGNNVGDSVLKVWGLSQDIEEHTFYSSVIIHY